MPGPTMPKTKTNAEPSPNLSPTETTSTAEPSPSPALTTKQPYTQMAEIISDIIELYHKEIRNLNMYESLPELVPNLEEEEIVLSIINHTKNNIQYLEQMYLGLTGDTINQLSMPEEELSKLSYEELLRNTLFSKTDTLEQYETIYRIIPVQPYKDVLFEIIIGQLKDATSSNYLISLQTQM